MPLPTIAGRYLAIPTSWEVGEYNNSPIFDMQYQLTQYCDPAGGWQACAGDLSMRKRFFLKKTDGTFSQHAINSLMKSLGWDGGSLKSLANGAWGQNEVQLTVGYEKSKKDGKDYIGVIFMNEKDYEGEHLTSDPAIVQSLDAKYGQDLRAQLAMTGKPATPKKPTTPAKPLEPKAAAWAEFKGKTPGMSDDQRKTAWIETVLGYSGKSYQDPAVDWSHVANSIAEHGPYVAPAPAMAEDDIPF